MDLQYDDNISQLKSSTSDQTEILELWKMQILTKNGKLKPVYEPVRPYTIDILDLVA